MDESEIIRFFRNETLFITGGTGFLGKVLVEKLLRLCDLKKIYILVRAKKGKTVEDRCNDYFNYACFERLKNADKDYKSKINFIDGDCEFVNLGLRQECQEMLITETTIIIHAAANVKFDQPLRTAAKINVGSTKDILDMAKLMPQLKAFIYVSTAYSNCPNSEINEEFYEPPITYKQLFSIVEATHDNEDLLEEIAPTLLGKWPNAYVYTKSIAESLIKLEGKNLPVAIIRPAVVTSTIEEPISGWIDNFYGVIGLTLSIALGFFRCLYVNKKNTAQIVPVDFVANNILAAAWNIAQEKNIIVYNYVGSDTNVINWDQYKTYLEKYGFAFPTVKVILYYSFIFQENKLWHNISVFFLHTVLAYTADFILICIGRQPIAVENYKKLKHMVGHLHYFTINKWNFHQNNVKNLWAKMGTEDKMLFKFNMDDLNWDSYVKDAVIGARIFLLKDPLDTLPRARRKLRILAIAHYFFISVFWVLVFLLLKCLLNLFLI